jgi:hypothetical protein
VAEDLEGESLEDSAPEPAGEELALKLAELSQRSVITPSYSFGIADVGVLKGGQGCPPAPPPLVGDTTQYILLDNEDRRNKNNRGGWLGASYSSTNTYLELCQVDGLQFSGKTEAYMVVALNATNCPSGAVRMARHFDTENSGNISASSIPGVIQGTRDVLIQFCAFKPNTGWGAAFPNIGREYGVFAPARSSFSLQDGFFYLDDEDSHNDNYWVNSDGAVSDFGEERSYWNILNGGVNTGMDVARVR